MTAAGRRPSKAARAVRHSGVRVSAVGRLRSASASAAGGPSDARHRRAPGHRTGHRRVPRDFHDHVRDGRSRVGRRPADARTSVGGPREAGVGAARSGGVDRPAAVLLRCDERQRHDLRAARPARRATGVPTRCSKPSPACRSMPAELRSVVTGCASRPNVAGSAGDRRRLAGHDRRQRRDLPISRQANRAWRIVTTLHAGADGWRAGTRTSSVACHGRFSSSSTRGPVRSCSSSCRRWTLNTPLGPEAFQLQVPATAETISVDELRRSGPLGGK